MGERIGKLAVLFLSFLCFAMHAESLQDGGRDVSVRLFSTRTLQSVTLTALDANTWTASCAACAHHRLKAPLQVLARKELFAGGHLKITDDKSQESKSAAGLWHLQVPSNHSDIDVVLTLPSERYVAAVLNAETSTGELPASLQAMAIVARTYALNGNHYTAARGYLPADLCDSTQCQAMRLGPVSQAIDGAVRGTAGETLWFRGRRASVFFSENCGGTSEDVGSVWPTSHAVPYLASHADPYCVRRGPAAWHAEIALKDLSSIAVSQNWQLPRSIDTAKIVRRSLTHRPTLIEFANSSARATVNAGALRFAIDRALGWNQVRSGQFEIAVRHGMLIFDGRGYGHGVGLCQAGASEMATEHKSAAEILAFYFRGTSMGIGPDDHGWLVVHSGPLAVRSTHELTAAELKTIEESWKQATQRFRPRRPVSPELVFAPSVELFRQMTAQPGWVAASTSGSQIVLEPEDKLRATLNATLLHEMLHVLVESEAAARTPLWLREGLVEELAEERNSSETRLSGSALDEALLHPVSQAADQQVHAAAASRVHALLARYGFSIVRGWLSTGVPAGVA